MLSTYASVGPRASGRSQLISSQLPSCPPFRFSHVSARLAVPRRLGRKQVLWICQWPRPGKKRHHGRNSICCLVEAAGVLYGRDSAPGQVQAPRGALISILPPRVSIFSSPRRDGFAHLPIAGVTVGGGGRWILWGWDIYGWEPRLAPDNKNDHLSVHTPCTLNRNYPTIHTRSTDTR